jgi:hypothetical protein
MIAQRRFRSSKYFKEKITVMKKLMTLMLGLAFLTTTVAISFAQGTKSDSTGKKKKGKKGSGTTKSDTTKSSN